MTAYLPTLRTSPPPSRFPAVCLPFMAVHGSHGMATARWDVGEGAEVSCPTKLLDVIRPWEFQPLARDGRIIFRAIGRRAHHTVPMLSVRPRMFHVSNLDRCHVRERSSSGCIPHLLLFLYLCIPRYRIQVLYIHTAALLLFVIDSRQWLPSCGPSVKTRVLGE